MPRTPLPEPMSAALAEFMNVAARAIVAMRDIEGPYELGLSTTDWRGVLKVDNDGNESIDLTVRVPPQLDRIEIKISVDTEANNFVGDPMVEPVLASHTRVKVHSAPQSMMDDERLLDHLVEHHGWVGKSDIANAMSHHTGQINIRDHHERDHADPTGKHLDHDHA